jgi:tight adherence protein C
MDFTTILPIAIFGGITIAAWAIMSAFGGEDTRATERLEEFKNPLLRDKKNQKKGLAAAIDKAAPALSKALGNKSELEQNELQVRLANAGYNNPQAATLYLALKTLMLIGGASLGAAYGLTFYGLDQSGLTAIALAGGIAFYIPEIGLWWQVRTRKEAIFLSLPDVLDLLVVCVEAGLGLDAGMRRVSEELKDTAPEICDEIALCNLQLQMGRNRREVLHDLGVRTGVDDVRALVAILIQADRFGSSIAQALRVQSDSMRVKRRQIAEEKAQKTSVQMLFPMVIFIFPGIFVVLVGPAAIKMIDQMLNK